MSRILLTTSEIEALRQDWMEETHLEWTAREAQAQMETKRLKEERAKANRILIGIKAQHPLTEGGLPGLEYTIRLEKALEAKRNYEQKGYEVDFVVVGGVHEGCADVTLADAGAEWLIGNGVEEPNIKRFPVVFSGNDEDRIFCNEFLTGNEYADLHVVLSLGQLPRSALYCIYMGVQPQFDTVTIAQAKPHHSLVGELWGPWAVPVFARGIDAVEKMTAEICQKHRDVAAAEAEG